MSPKRALILSKRNNTQFKRYCNKISHHQNMRYFGYFKVAKAFTIKFDASVTTTGTPFSENHIRESYHSLVWHEQ